ncbi:MAG: UPF0182 family protein [Candidatus Limnocylindria bacterium]
MRNIFDDFLEELQRRQQEQDARREGRSLPPRSRRRGGNGSAFDDDDDDGTPPRRIVARFGRGARIVVVLLGIGLLFAILSAVAGFVTDLMWYDSLGMRQVFLTRLAAQLGWFVAGTLLFAVVALASALAARRLAPRVPVRRIGAFEIPDVARPAMIAIVVVAVLLALAFGASWGARWEQILLFANGGSFGRSDPNFGVDVGFYVFELPFLRFIQSWAVTTLLVVIGLTLAVYAVGTMRWQFHLTAPVRAHLSILGALLLVAIAAGYQLDILELVYSDRGIGGAMQAVSYTDANAQRPAYFILTFVALASAALLLANIWFRTLWMLVLALGAWLGLSLIVGGIYPAAVQRLQVVPNELAVERPFIERHIAATRDAFDLDAIDERSFTGEAPPTRALFEAEDATLRNARLWDYRPLLVTFGQQQILRQYYEFVDVDIDRYEIDGEERQVMLSGREIRTEKLNASARTWTNERLVFTHGYGITAVPVDAVTPEGQPDYLVSGINREPDLPVGEPRIYFGQATDSYVIVDTTTDEFDYPLEERSVTTSWQGDNGIGLDNLLARLLFAFRFGDVNLLISNQLTSDSQVLFNRQIEDRLAEIAPFLEFDPDPYLVSAGGRLVWIADAYTISDRYPNAQPLTEVYPGVNYLRNAVKATVDAYDGSVHFYVADPDDPIIAAYERIFPGLFEPLDAMPEELLAHIRFPEWLFRAQNEAYLLYHVTADEQGAATFYNKDDVWAIPEQQFGVDSIGTPLEPYYVIMRIPGEEEAEFVLIEPIVAARRPNMVAWVAARSDGEHYGERISFRFPSDSTTLGPAQVQARIDQDSTISAQFTLWNQSGSSVVRGNLLVLPMGDSIIYLEPIYLQSTTSSFPEFKRVILVSQTRVAFAPTLEEALRQLLGEAAVPPPEEGNGNEPPPGDVAALVERAQELYDQAQEALTQGDLATYDARLEELDRVLNRLADLVGAPTPGASGAASPSATPVP